MRTFDHAASGCHWGSAGERSARGGFSQVVAEDKLDRLLDAHRPAGDAAVTQALGHVLVGIFIFLPDTDVGVIAVWRLGDLLAGAPLFESRANVKRFTLGGQYHSEEPLTSPPANASEVIE